MIFSGGNFNFAINVYDRAKQRTVGRFLDNIGPRITSYEHTKTRLGGHEALRVTLVVDVDEAFIWLNRLMCVVNAFGPDAEPLFDGFISSVSFTVDQETIDLSINDMANAIAVLMQQPSGETFRTDFIDNLRSQALYGIKELVYAGGEGSYFVALQIQETLLNDRGWPKARRSGGTFALAGSKDAEIQLTINVSGWAQITKWSVRGAATVNSSWLLQDQFKEYIRKINLDHNYLSEDFSRVTALGASNAIIGYRDYKDIYTRINELITLGDVNRTPLAWGIDFGRIAYLKTWNGNATKPHYRRNLGSNVFYDIYGSPVPLWRIEADTLYQITDLVETQPPLNGVDFSTTYYIDRVVFSANENGITIKLEPERNTAWDVFLARMRN